MRGGSSRSEDAALFRGIPPTRYERRRIAPWSNDASRRDGGLRVAHERSAFVAAEHSPELVHEFVEEPMDERRLAHARSAADTDRNRAPGARRGERVMQCAQLRLATGQYCVARAFVVSGYGRGFGRRPGRAGYRSKAPQDLVPAWPHRGFAMQQRDAQRIEVCRDAVDALARGEP
jgi:hypothetical protein